MPYYTDDEIRQLQEAALRFAHNLVTRGKSATRTSRVVNAYLQTAQPHLVERVCIELLTYRRGCRCAAVPAPPAIPQLPGLT